MKPAESGRPGTPVRRRRASPPIAATPSAVPLGDAHRAVIDARLAEHTRAPDDLLTRDEVLADARRG